MNSKIAVFLAPGGRTFTGELVAESIVNARHRMRLWLAKYERPFIARIAPDGRLTMVDDFSGFDE